MNKLGCAALLCSVPWFANAADLASNDEPQSLSIGMAVDQQLSAVFSVGDEYRFILGNRGMAFDYIFARGDLNLDYDLPSNWYVGGGAWTQWDHDFGARMPIGMDVHLNKQLLVYGQVHPQLNLHSGPELEIGAAVGMTYRF